MEAAAAAVAPSDLARAGRLDPLPARARDVQLLGDFAGSGYTETPRLVRRGDGQLIKLTPLLYELVDAIDGRRGLEELARELTRRVGKQASAEDITFLVEHKLRPLGVLQQPDGREPEVVKANPLLVLRPRAIISRAELTRRLTSPFVWLFAPMVMLPLLLAFGAVGSWLLIEKGLASALHQALHEPWLILAIWALVILSAAFHEIGHAAACRYGGARPGAIGGGLYLIWPAFYTDVTDAYRLGRGARLRVDLGGLYFSAIFAVATAGVWRLTGADALLLAIAIQLLQMVRQLAPFIRADGYHILADIIGVPDLFAHIKPTLLDALPSRWGRARDSALKPWARATVTAWVLITVPALVTVLVMIVLAFPRIAGTAWDSIGLRWEEAATHWNGGDIAGVALSLITIALAALPALAILYLVSYLAQRLARRTWRVTAGRPRLRGLAVLGGAALLALIVWAWWPGDKYQPIEPQEGGPLPTIVAPPVAAQPAQALLLPAPEATTAGSIPTPDPMVRLIYLLSSPSAAYATHAPSYPGLLPGGSAGGKLPGAHLVSPGAAELLPGPGDSESAEPPLAPGPTEPPEGGESGLAWPFPFDPPDAPAPGDNRAMAVNTTDGSSLWEFAFSLLLLETGNPVSHTNEAHAYASCTSCITGAVAFQVLLIVGQVDTILPVNAAVAANFECVQCHTYAFAYQIIVTLISAPDAEVQRMLDLALQRLQFLEENVGALTPAELYVALEAVKQDILDALKGLVAAETASTASQDAGAVQEGEDPLPPPEEPASSEEQTAPSGETGVVAAGDGTGAETPVESPSTQGTPPEPDAGTRDTVATGDASAQSPGETSAAVTDGEAPDGGTATSTGTAAPEFEATPTEESLGSADSADAGVADESSAP